MPGAPRLLLVEDDHAIREGLRRSLEREGFEVLTAARAAEALEVAAREEPDLVLLDLGLPDGDGRDVCRDLRRRRDVPVIMVTARGTETDRIVGLELGADDYVVKPFSGAEVAARVRAVLRRAGARAGGQAPAAAIAFGTTTVDLRTRRAHVGDAELDLTRRELDLLAALVGRGDAVVSRDELFEEVWGGPWYGSPKVLDVQIGALRKKLAAADGPVIETVRGIGYRLAEGP